MAGVAPDSGKMLAKWESLRAESARLRLEFLNIELDLSHTLASLASTRQNESFRENSRNAAWKGYRTIVHMLRKDLPAEVQKDLETRAERLREFLESASEADEHEFQVPETATAPRQAEPDTPKLTSRELEVLACIAKGQSTKQAAASLGITFKTAACHRYHVMTKLGIHETASLVRYAIRNGLAKP